MPHSIPRGFLRHLIISLLRKSELTGTEIMETLEERSDGRYKPSPGSVYPLLASLAKAGIIHEIPEGSKRYALSEEGREHVKAMFRRKHDLEDKTRLSRFLLIKLLEPRDQAHFHIHGLKLALELLDLLSDSLSQSEQKKVLKRLGKISSQLEQLTTKLQEGDSSHD